MNIITTLTCAACGDTRSGSSYNHIPDGWNAYDQNHGGLIVRMLFCSKPQCTGSMGEFVSEARKPDSGYIAGKTEEVGHCLMCKQPRRILTAPAHCIGIGGFSYGSWLDLRRHRNSFHEHDSSGIVCPKCVQEKLRPLFGEHADWFFTGKYPDLHSVFRE